MEWATSLKVAGMHVSVLTPKHGATHSDAFCFRELPVYRPIRLFRPGWMTQRQRSVNAYIQALRDWIVSEQSHCDLLVSDGGREEAIAVVQAGQTLKVPTVVRLAGQGDASDLDYHSSGRPGRRCRNAIQAADAVIVSDATSHRRWLGLGGKPQQTHTIRVGCKAKPEQGLSSRENLRRAMSRINGDLLVPDAHSVVLSIERMFPGSGVMSLVDAAFGLSTHLPSLNFWFVGDGPMRDTIFTRMKADGLRQATAMPGSFALLQDVFCVADLMVHIGDEGFDYQIPTALACGLPLVMANSNVARDFFTISETDVMKRLITRRGQAPAVDFDRDEPPGHLIQWFDPSRPSTLRFAIDHLVGNLDAARRTAEQARKRMIRQRSYGESVERCLHLFRDLITQHSAASGGVTPQEKVP